MTAIKVTFESATAAPFVTELKERVTDYFRVRGVSDKANWVMVARTISMLGLTSGSYALILWGGLPKLAMLGLAVVMGVGLAGVGFGVSHDALHGAYSRHPLVNRFIGYTHDLCGANGYMWRITHNVIHHTYTNIHGIDEDLEVSPLLRLSPRATYRWYHRFQPLYAFLLYSFSTLFWVFVKDYKYFLQRHLGPYKDYRPPASEVVTLVVGKALYYGWAIVLPLVVLRLPWWQFAIGFLAMNLTAGLILGVVFQLAHVVEDTAHPLPNAEGAIGDVWVAHELATTANFANGNPLVTWYVGGLNHQIEHHLFPKVCSVHYPALAPIVRDVVRSHGLPYYHAPTLFAAIRSHYRTLQRHARPPLVAA
jgi:linoleoyl-CoA desaturase